MGFFKSLIQLFGSKSETLKGPTFVKKFSENNKQLKDLEKILKIAPKDLESKIKQEMKCISYGINGEKNIAYELKNSHMPILILHDLYLKYNGLSAQIDYVVIGSKFILVIECKNMFGEIEITNSGDFIRYFKDFNGKLYKKEGIYSPIVQNERHVELIKDILKKEGLLKKDYNGLINHIVTIANPKTVINSRFAKKEIKDHIIKHEQLINKMKSLNNNNNNNKCISQKNMNEIAKILLKYNGKFNIDYKRKYGLSKETSINNKENKITQKEKRNNFKVSKDLEDTKIYKDLKEYRLNKSKKEGIPPYCVYTNRELENIINSMPKTLDELKTINGFGTVKCEKYGRDIIKIVKKNR